MGSRCGTHDRAKERPDTGTVYPRHTGTGQRAPHGTRVIHTYRVSTPRWLIYTTVASCGKFSTFGGFAALFGPGTNDWHGGSTTLVWNPPLVVVYPPMVVGPTPCLLSEEACISVWTPVLKMDLRNVHGYVHPPTRGYRHPTRGYSTHPPLVVAKPPVWWPNRPN